VPHFRVVVNGENFWLQVDGQQARMGFYTTRFVEAENALEAGHAAVRLLRIEGKLAPLNAHSDPPRVSIDKAELVDAADVPVAIPGFTFYADEPDAKC
jgi:hypothetical protein